MKRSEVDFSEEYKTQLEDELLYKNIVKFARKFNLGICSVGTADSMYDLLKRHFERFHTNINFEEEWQKVVEE